MKRLCMKGYSKNRFADTASTIPQRKWKGAVHLTEMAMEVMSSRFTYSLQPYVY